jgi:hypothetical protein
LAPLPVVHSFHSKNLANIQESKQSTTAEYAADSLFGVGCRAPHRKVLKLERVKNSPLFLTDKQRLPEGLTITSQGGNKMPPQGTPGLGSPGNEGPVQGCTTDDIRGVGMGEGNIKGPRWTAPGPSRINFTTCLTLDDKEMSNSGSTAGY